VRRRHGGDIEVAALLDLDGHDRTLRGGLRRRSAMHPERRGADCPPKLCESDGPEDKTDEQDRSKKRFADDEKRNRASRDDDVGENQRNEHPLRMTHG
jgi:hypothetical protein